MDFPVTRLIIEKVDGWVNHLAVALMPPKIVLDTDGAYHWEFAEKSPSVLQVTKMVRMVSGIRAALLLADQGFVVESANLLRMVSDFATEITAVSEGVLRGEMTTAQRKFVEQFFRPTPRSLEEFAAQEKDFYVSREELIKSEMRLAAEAGDNPEELRQVRRLLNKGYDDYVHGSYLTAMELYDDTSKSFRVRGVVGRERTDMAKRGVAGKLHEVVGAMEFVAFLRKEELVFVEIRNARHLLEASGEWGGTINRTETQS